MAADACCTQAVRNRAGAARAGAGISEDETGSTGTALPPFRTRNMAPDTESMET